jgi:Leucine-rich repeat (LRR) protein
VSPVGQAIGDVGTTQVAGAIQECPHLTALNLDDNDISDSGVETLIASTKDRRFPQHLTDINLEGNEQISMAVKARLDVALNPTRTEVNYVELLLEMVATGNGGEVVRVRILGRAIGDSGAAQVAGAVKECPQLAEMVLSSNGITDIGCCEIAESIRTGCCPQLVELDLQSNNITDNGVETLVTSTRDPRFPPRLSAINLDGNEQISLAVKARLDVALSPTRSHVTYLDLLLEMVSAGHGAAVTKVDLVWKAIEDSGAMSVARAIPECVQLEHLSLCGNAITDDGCSAIVTALQTAGCSQLTKLDLSGNRITDSGVEMLISFVNDERFTPHLSEVDLDGNEQISMAVKARLDVALNPTRIEVTYLELLLGMVAAGFGDAVASVSLIGKAVGDHGAALVAEAITECPKLTALNLFDNGVTDVGVKTLIAAADDPRFPLHLTDINLDGNEQISPGVKAKLDVALDPSRTLVTYLELLLEMVSAGHGAAVTSVSLIGKAFGADGAILVASAINSCPQLTNLVLCGNGITDFGCSAIVETIRAGGCSQLTALDFSSNNVTNNGVEALIAATEDRRFPSHLANINFHGNLHISLSTKARLDVALNPTRTEVTYLELLLEMVAAGHGAAVSRVDLLGGVWHIGRAIEDGSAVHVAAITDVAASNSGVVTGVSMIGKAIGDGGAVQVAGAIKECPQLTELRLCGNAIADVGCSSIIETILTEYCPQLKSLDLSANDITDFGVEAIIAATKDRRFPPHLTDVHLNDNEQISIAVKTRLDVALNPTRQHVTYLELLLEMVAAGNGSAVTTVHITEKDIADGGAAQLATALQECPELTELILCGNKITDVGCAAIVETVQTECCPHLTTLDLSSNDITECGVESLIASAKDRRFPPHLTHVGLGGNEQIGPAVKARLDVALNPSLLK